MCQKQIQFWHDCLSSLTNVKARSAESFATKTVKMCGFRGLWETLTRRTQMHLPPATARYEAPLVLSSGAQPGNLMHESEQPDE